MGFEYLLLGLAHVICLPIFLKYVGLPRTFMFASLCGFWPLLLTTLSQESVFTVPWPWSCGEEAEVNMAYIFVFACLFAALADAPSKLLSSESFGPQKYGLTQTGIYACSALANLVGPAIFANMFAISTAMGLWWFVFVVAALLMCATTYFAWLFGQRYGSHLQKPYLADDEIPGTCGVC